MKGLRILHVKADLLSRYLSRPDHLLVDIIMYVHLVLWTHVYVGGHECANGQASVQVYALQWRDFEEKENSSMTTLAPQILFL